MRRVYGFTFIAALAVVMLIGLGIVSSLRDELSGDYESQLFHGSLYGKLFDDYRGVAVVAHNSGNRSGTLASVQDAGVPIIEIDVRTINDRLYAAHSSPTPLFGRYLTRTEPLGLAWRRSSDAPATILDLKDSSSTFLKRLVSFLKDNQTDERKLIISSPSERALRQLREEYPDAILLLSVGTVARLERAQTDPELAELVDGVTARASLFDGADDVHLLKENDMLVYVWVVNSLEDLNRFVQWGVDAVTTDNLAIIELLAPNIDEDIEQAEEELKKGAIKAIGGIAAQAA